MDIWTAVRTILEKNPGIRAKELVEKIHQKTDLERSAIYSHLGSFFEQGRIDRKKGRYFLLEGSVGRRHTKLELGKLSLALEAILIEDWNLWRIGESSDEREGLTERIERNGIGLKEFALDHLRTGYPSVYREWERWRKSKKRVEEKLLKDGHTEQETRDILNMVENIGGEPKISERCERLLAIREEAYRALFQSINQIKLEVDMGRHMKGSCGWCFNPEPSLPKSLEK